MATRLDLGDLLNRAQNPYAGMSGGSTRDLFAGLFNPGEIYTGFEGPTRLPKSQDALSVLKTGGAGFGAFDSMFGPNGEVLDPHGLLRALNAGQVLANRPNTPDAFNKRYGEAPSVVSEIGGIGVQPNIGGYRQAQDQAYARDDVNRNLMDWLRGLGYEDSTAPVMFDPNRLRYTGFNIAPGLDLRNTTRSALEDFAQKTFGVDLMTMAASPDALLQARQKYLANPNSLINENDPATLNLSRIPGLSQQTSALRLQDYSTAITNARNTVAQNNKQEQANALLNFLRSNPEGLRTGRGQYLANTQESRTNSAGAQEAATPPPMDYSTFYQMGLLPDLMNIAMSQASMRF